MRHNLLSNNATVTLELRRCFVFANRGTVTMAVRSVFVFVFGNATNVSYGLDLISFNLLCIPCYQSGHLPAVVFLYSLFTSIVCFHVGL